MNAKASKKNFELVCPDCQSPLSEPEPDHYYCNQCERAKGKSRASFLDFMLDVELDEDYQEFYEEEGTEADEDGGPRINAQKFKIPNVLNVLPEDVETESYLDMGCGGGWIMESLREELHPDSMTGVDISATRLQEASRRNPDATFLRAPAEAVPVQSDSFDLITCLDVIEHLKEPHRVLEEANRLAPRLVIKFPIEDTVFDRFQKEFWWPFKRSLKAALRGTEPEEHFEAHLHRFSFESARSLLESNGFSIVDESIILNPWTEGESFMYPPAYNVTDSSSIGKKFDFHVKRSILKGTRMLTYVLMNPFYYRIFNSGIYLYCERNELNDD